MIKPSQGEIFVLTKEEIFLQGKKKKRKKKKKEKKGYLGQKKLILQFLVP